MMLKKGPYLLLVIFLLAGCGQGSAVSSFLQTEDVCTVSTVSHEAEYVSDPTLVAAFDELTIARLESATDEIADDDSGIPGMDVIPYRLDEGETFDFNLSETGPVLRAVIADAQENVLLDVNRGNPAVDITLEAGDYTLTLESDAAGGIVFIGPSQCEATESSSSLIKTVVASNPGISVAEVPSQHIAIGVETAITAFVGYVPESASQEPFLVTSYADYVNQFGAASSASLLSLAVYQFFAEGGEEAYIVGIPANVDDSLPDEEAIIGDVSSQTGLHALDAISDFNLLVIPDLGRLSQRDAAIVTETAMDYANGQNVFFIADYPSSITTLDSILNWVEQLNSLTGADSTALYFPQIEAIIPTNSHETVTMGAGGAVAGLYSNVDLSGGVWQAPAGVNYGDLNAAIDLSFNLTNTQQNQTDAAGMNAIRDFIPNGITVGSARTLALSGEYTSISVRRVRYYIDRTIQEGLEWVVFETSNPQIWNAVTQEISTFLNTSWQQGALKGAEASQAFYVVCESANNSAEDISLGILNLEVGIAPSRSSEFIILSFQFSVQPGQ